MTASPDLLHELRISRPVASDALRSRVRETARVAPAPRWSTRFGLSSRRVAGVALPAAAALALATAGVLGLARSDDPATQDAREAGQLEALPGTAPSTTLDAQDATVGPTPGRAQRVTATLTVEVEDSEAVSVAAQDALELMRTLGGHVVRASVSTGEQGSATLTVRVPVAKVQGAIAQLSALGPIVAQEVTIDDLQASLDDLEQREAGLRARIASIRARLETESLDAQTAARLRSRLATLRADLADVRQNVAATKAEARMSTIQLTVLTPDLLGGAAPAPSRLDRTLDEALNVLVWEGVVALAITIVVAPLALVALAAWLARRFYRRREDERLLAS